MDFVVPKNHTLQARRAKVNMFLDGASAGTPGPELSLFQRHYPTTSTAIHPAGSPAPDVE